MYVGLMMSILTGPIAFATPPVLRLALPVEVESMVAREAVVVPNANAILFETKPRLEVDEEDGDETELEFGPDAFIFMCIFAGA